MQLENHSQSSLVVWRLLDGKPGHVHQSQGLVQALQQQRQVHVVDIALHSAASGWWYALTGHWPLGAGLPAPDLIVGAGHATHGHLLAAQRVYGGKTVCLMQPTVPVSWFDVCLIPEHDQYRGSGSFIETRGVLNHILVPSAEAREPQQTLLLVGGPSKHYAWDDALVVAQVFALVHAQPEHQFVLTTSRRTPQTFIAALQRIHLSNLRIYPYADTASDWVQNALQRAHTVWVTEDSVSMVYESLTAQAAVGLMNVQPRRFVDQQLVTRFDLAGAYRQALRPATGFNEAQRCGQLLLRHLSQPQSRSAGRLVVRVA
jgi:uncharacterized protein